MKRTMIISLVLALAMVFFVAGTTMAFPLVSSGDKGQLNIFSQYWSDELSLGAGYTVAKGFELGVEYYLKSEDLGLYATRYFESLPLLINLDYRPEQDWLGAVGYCILDLDPVLLGLGAGLETDPMVSEVYLGVMVNLSPVENVDIYGAYDYYPSTSDHDYKVGVSARF